MDRHHGSRGGVGFRSRGPPRLDEPCTRP